MASRRERRLQRGKKTKRHAAEQEEQASPSSPSIFHVIYHDNYKKLLIIPFILLFLALLQIGIQVTTTGDFLNKGVSLRGGITITVPVDDNQVTVAQIETLMTTAFPDTEFVIRGLSEFGVLRGVTIEAAVDAEDDESVHLLEKNIVERLATLLPGIEDQYSIEIIGPSLGATFFQQTMTAMLIAFMLMGLVVFFYFGQNVKAKVGAVILSLAAYLLFTQSTVSAWQTGLLIVFGIALITIYAIFSPPSAAVILAAFSDIVVTLAVMNVFGVKISAAGVAAFLMLIGYSVDTDILLSTRVLRQRQGSVYESVVSSLKTGMLMSFTSFIAALIGFIVRQSATIKQIMLIILVGLLADMINTWLQNAGIIRMYAERRAAR